MGSVFSAYGQEFLTGTEEKERDKMTVLGVRVELKQTERHKSGVSERLMNLAPGERLPLVLLVQLKGDPGETEIKLERYQIFHLTRG